MAIRRLRAILRTFVAIATAQAFALQILFVAVAAGQVAAVAQQDSSPFVICYGDHTAATPAGDDNKTPAPVHHAPCVLCSLAMGSGTLAPAMDSYIPLRYVAAASYGSVPAPLAASPRPTPRLSQGPPLSA